MGWLHFLLLLYLSGKGSALNECNSCECCKTNRCEFQNGNHGACLDGCIGGYYGANCRHACLSNCLACENASPCIKCMSGFYGAYCDKCPDNCSACSSKSNCNTCRDGFYSGKKEDIEVNHIYSDCRYKCQGNCESCTSYDNCTSCKNGFYSGYQYSISKTHYSDCPHPCKDSCKSCTSYHTCTVCKDGKYNGDHNECRENCHSACKACTSYNKCTKCETGKYGSSCQNDCGLGCKTHQCDKSTGACYGICNAVNGKCKKGCKDGYWGDKCEDICDRNCLKCDQLNGECSVCRIGKYFKDCSKDCSTKCSAINSFLMCAVDDGACLSGCDTPTKYGSHCEKNCSSRCENDTCNWKTGYCLNGCADNFFGKQCNKACSVNCVSDIGRSCNDVNGDCIHGCKDGVHGDTCEKKCSNNCVNKTCEKATGKCVHGCRMGFSGSSCTEASYTEHTDDGEFRSSNIGVFIGVGIGAAIATLLAVGVIVLVKRYTWCRNQEEDSREPPNEMRSISGRNAMSSMEDQESDAVYENVSEYEQLQENTKDTSTYSHLVTATSPS